MGEEIKDFNAKVKDLDLKCISPEDLKMDTPIKDLFDLPFVTKGKKNTKKDRKFWDCKSTGIKPLTYWADCDLGTEYGRLYLNHLISGSDCPLPLTWILKGMNKIEDETQGFNGISVGFLSTVQDFAKIGAKVVQILQSEEAPEKCATKSLMGRPGSYRLTS